MRSLAALLLALFVLAAGCARETDDATVIRFWGMGREAEVVAGFLPQFEREHPGIRVELQNIPWSAAHEKLLTAFAADGLPDICQLGNTWIPEFAALDTLTPLQPYIDRSRVVVPSDYFAGIWATNVIDGQVLGIPWYVDTRLLFYRKDILRQAGIASPPRTWAEWETAMAAIKRDVGPKRYAVLLPLNEFEQQLSLGLQTGDPLLRDGDDYGNFSGSGFRKALAFYASMFERGWAPPMSETQISNVWDEFFNGFYAFYLSGPWNIREFRKRAPAELRDQWGTMPLPGPDGPGAGIAGGTSLVLFRHSTKKDAAWKLIEFLSRPDIQERFHAELGDLPPRRSTWESPGLANDELARAFRDQLERVKPTPKVLEWERIVQEMRLATERVVRGGESQDKALRDLDAKVDALLAKRRWIRARDRKREGAAAANEAGKNDQVGKSHEVGKSDEAGSDESGLSNAAGVTGGASTAVSRRPSSPRRRGSMDFALASRNRDHPFAFRSSGKRQRPWIPAFAGMTAEGGEGRAPADRISGIPRYLPGAVTTGWSHAQ